MTPLPRDSDVELSVKGVDDRAEITVNYDRYDDGWFFTFGAGDHMDWGTARVSTDVAIQIRDWLTLHIGSPEPTLDTSEYWQD